MEDEDVLRIVRVELNARTVSVIHDDEDYYRILDRRFPEGFNRIAWEQVDDKKEAEVYSFDWGERTWQETEVKLRGFESVVRDWFRVADIDLNDEVACLGEHQDFGLKMSILCFLDHFSELLSLPQHTYVMPSNGAWCLNYTIDGTLYFAWAKS